MKLRVARKILLNNYYGKCHYSNETIMRAAKKYQPYNIKDCKKKNKELKEQGSSLIFMPYILSESVPLINDGTIKPLKINTKYSKIEVNPDFYGEIKYENLFNNN